MLFMEDNELNIAFPFVILTWQNCIQRNRPYHGILENFHSIENTTAHAQLGYHARKSQKT